MGPLIVRIILLAGGLGSVEIGLVVAIGQEIPLGWVPFALGLALLVAGSAGFMRPLLGEAPNRGGER